MTNTDRVSPKAARKQASAAATWRRDEAMERLIEMKSSREDRFAELLITPSQRISLGHYLRARAAAAAEGIDTGGQT